MFYISAVTLPHHGTFGTASLPLKQRKETGASTSTVHNFTPGLSSGFIVQTIYGLSHHIFGERKG